MTQVETFSLDDSGHFSQDPLEDMLSLQPMNCLCPRLALDETQHKIRDLLKALQILKTILFGDGGHAHGTVHRWSSEDNL